MIQKIIRDTDGNVITEKPIGEIEIIRPPFKCVIKRNGQESPEKGNRVIVQLVPFVFNDSMVCEFNISFFRLGTKYINKNKKGVAELFWDNTWKGAFEQAESYFNAECIKYERLLFERDQALKNAE